MNAEPIFIANDNTVEVDGAQNVNTGAYLNSATVTCTLKTEAEVDVPNAVGLPMGYVASSNGTYQGTLPATLALTNGAHYWLYITGVEGGVDFGFRIRCRARYRGLED